MLARAAALVGGEDALAKQLCVSRMRLDLWLMGAERIPVWVFLQLVDILLALPSAAAPAPKEPRKDEEKSPSVTAK